MPKAKRTSEPHAAARKRQRVDVSLPEIAASNPNIRTRLAEAEELVAILDDLGDEVFEEAEQGLYSPKGFFWNRNWIARAYKEDRLYVITDDRLYDINVMSLFQARGARFNPILRSDVQMSTIPAFAVTEAGHPETIDLLWVRNDWRRFGYARALVDLLGATRVGSIPEATAFWTRLGFKPTGEEHPRLVWMQRQLS